jgi:ATP-binding cassette subfamily B protein RaxB
MCWFAFAQVITLVLPLLSMWAVDRSVRGLSLGIVGTVSVGFFALSLTSIAVSLCGELLQGKAKRLASVALSRVAFDALAGRSANWFDASSAALLQNRIGSLNAQLDFYLGVARSTGAVAATFVVGVAALLFLSPWLLIPGFCSLLLSMTMDVMFQRGQTECFGTLVEATQRRQAFILDTLAQLPLISRFGAAGSARVRYASLVRTAATAEARLQSVRGWRSALGGLAKSADTLFFVSLAAALMGGGRFTIGGFVALGAYKDLLASSAGVLFQLALQRQSQKIHELQAAPLLTPGRTRDAGRREVTKGQIVCLGVFFRYGSLDRPVLDGASFSASAGECTVIRGPSGTGKSTIAKLLVGALAPERGSILIDGDPVTGSMSGVSAVLQSDRLIGGTIRENITMFRRQVTDADILDALKRACVDDFVLGLPMGLNSYIAEGVAGLSGGQRQRLLIARALLEHPKLIVLDEATSSLDVDIEMTILDSLRASRTTTILISHRPELWQRADRLYSMDTDGHLIEETARPMQTGRCGSSALQS